MAAVTDPSNERALSEAAVRYQRLVDHRNAASSHNDGLSARIIIECYLSEGGTVPLTDAIRSEVLKEQQATNVFVLNAGEGQTLNSAQEERLRKVEEDLAKLKNVPEDDPQRHERAFLVRDSGLTYEVEDVHSEGGDWHAERYRVVTFDGGQLGASPCLHGWMDAQGLWPSVDYTLVPLKAAR